MPRFRMPSLYGVITAFVVASASLFVFSQVRPDLIFTNSIAAGGDMGAHVWTPRYLVDHLLPHGRITGWSPDWYAGFPALHFYFPLPMVAVAFLDLFLPSGIAFKLITVAGVVSLPASVWVFGRMAGLPFPVPAAMAAMTVPFLFDTGYTILGGNIASTLAGEFAFSIGLSLAFLFLGFLAHGLRTGQHRALTAVLCAAVILTHVIPTIFALVVGALLVTIAMASRIRQGVKSVLAPLVWSLPVAVVGGLLSAWWMAPFVWQRQYMNDMGWEKIGTGELSGMQLYGEQIVDYSDALYAGSVTQLLAVALAVGTALTLGAVAVRFPRPPVLIGCAAVAAMLAGGYLVKYPGLLMGGYLDNVAVAGAVALLICLTGAVYFKRTFGLLLALIAIIAAVAFVYAPQGQLWNARLLPFWYLSLYLIVGYLIGEIGYVLAKVVKRWSLDFADGLRITAPLVGLSVALALVVPTLPAPSWWPSVGYWHDPDSGEQASFIPGWAEWNYSGYDGVDEDGNYYKPDHPEFLSIMQMLNNAGRDRGCGRVMWEYESELDRFGTPMALMLSPIYTDGCMGSMEGLYFESSPTVPFHFLNQRELSQSPSSPMRDLPYASSIDVPAGVTKLQALGVKYYLAVTPAAQQGAAQDERLSIVASVPAKEGQGGEDRTWNLYEIEDSEIVEGLDVLPNVMVDHEGIETWRDGRIGAEHTDREAWLENALAAYTSPTDFDIPRSLGGPDNWPRVEDATDEPIRRVVDDPAEVGLVSVGDDRISFQVSEVGKPVLVKASYFPNWQVEGAEGPYRVTPNLVVVVPTETSVSLHYGRTTVDWISLGLTAGGFIGVLWLWRRPYEGQLRPERDQAS